jgi:hypothetical protein
MHSFSAPPANFHYTARIHPALTSIADEVCGTLARLFAYVMTLALLAVGAVTAWEHLLGAIAMEPSDKIAWSPADRSARAFAVNQLDFHNKTETYKIFRHLAGGRRDLLRWSGADGKPVGGGDTVRTCLGFIKRMDGANLLISGWSCQGNTGPARRGAIACMLNRLTLLSAGNDPKLAELFARAERRRSDCAASGTQALSADWLTGTDSPRLRGTF